MYTSKTVAIELFIHLLYFYLPVEPTSVTVSCPGGTFEGAALDTVNGQTMIAFRGIPYAKPPVGKLRFARPEPHPHIEEPFDATKQGKTCPYPIMLTRSMANRAYGEDCLILNIFTKSIDSLKDKTSPKKKVIVFVHGGGYIVGSSSRINPGSFVTEHDVIMVTINYRLGILGFLSTGNEASLGNYGLWDMALALKWVKNNIESFGGDPNDITISGESAGGSAVSYLALSPQTAGLFTKVYSHSGTATSFFGFSTYPQEDTVRFASQVGCWGGDVSANVDVTQSTSIVECLRKLPVERFTGFHDWRMDRAMFVPTVDGDFVPRAPLELMKDDTYLKDIGFFDKDYLIGVNNNEKAIMDRNRQLFEYIVNSNKQTTDEEKTAILSKITMATEYSYVAFRKGTESLDESLETTKSWYNSHYVGETAAFTELLGDVNFLIPTFDLADAASRGGPGKVWLLHFNHFPRFMVGLYRGTVHGAYLMYWFDHTLSEIETILQAGIDVNGTMGVQDMELKATFSAIIAQFMKTGDLSAPHTTDRLVPTWPPYTAQQTNYLDFCLQAKVKVDLEEEKRNLWQSNAEHAMKERKPHLEL